MYENAKQQINQGSSQVSGTDQVNYIASCGIITIIIATTTTIIINSVTMIISSNGSSIDNKVSMKE